MQINIFFINLDERKDRCDFIQNQFSNIPRINLIRIPAIKHQEGWIGCGLSHINIVEKYMTSDNYLIVMEDDCVIHDVANFYENLKNIISWLDANNDKWDIFNGNPSYITNLDDCFILCQDPKIIKYKSGFTANFIIYNSKNPNLRIKLLAYKNDIIKCVSDFKNVYIKKPKRKYIIIKKNRHILFNLNKKQYSLIYDKFLNKNFVCVTIVPFLSSQQNSISDIEKRKVNYVNAIKISETTLSKLVST